LTQKAAASDYSTAVLKGFPTSEGKPAPCKGKAFSGMAQNILSG